MDDFSQERPANIKANRNHAKPPQASVKMLNKPQIPKGNNLEVADDRR
jgi:hypothetical protein